MNVSLLQPVTPGVAKPAAAAVRAPERSFGSTLGGALRAPDSPDDARKAAEEFVAIAFVQPILKEVRESNQAAPPFGPTEAEKAFGPLLDAEIARQVVAKERYGLVDRVARQLLQSGGAAERALPEIDAHA